MSPQPPKKRVVAILQARLGSTRLPQKVLADVCGRPMLWHQIQRVKRAQAIDELVLATTDLAQDAPLVALGREAGIPVFTGSAEDVLDRYYHAAVRHQADVVVRVSGDCPLSDPAVIDRTVAHVLTHPIDYAATGWDFPDGLDVEAFTMEALTRAWKEATKPSEREHATLYLNATGAFKTERISFGRDGSRHRWSVDEPEDLEVIRRIYGALYPSHGHRFTVEDVLALVERDPSIGAPNAHLLRNEGLLTSWKAEHRCGIPRLRALERSEALWRRASPIIPAGTQTLSKGPSQFVGGVAPKYVERAQGSRVWDVDGNEYIDYPMALGSLPLGHNHPAVQEAIARQLRDGVSFSLMHPLEVEVAELLLSAVPWAQMIRFGKAGSDVTSVAVRLARAFTGRDLVLHCGYHGWHDWYVASTNRKAGVPDAVAALQASFPFNDLAALADLFETHRGRVAAVIMEPYIVTEPAPGFLDGVRELTRAHGALLIFDEVVSGFRYRWGPSHELFGVTPDLICFGKAIANGMPLSAVAGPREIMRLLEDDVFFSMTFGGEALSLAACAATLKALRQPDVYPHLWGVGGRLQQGLTMLIASYGLQAHVQCLGRSPRTVVVFRDTEGRDSLLLKSLFQQEALKRGILFNGLQLPSTAHTEDDIDLTLGAFQEGLAILQRAIRQGHAADLLEGTPIRPGIRPLVAPPTGRAKVAA